MIIMSQRHDGVLPKRLEKMVSQLYDSHLNLLPVQISTVIRMHRLFCSLGILEFQLRSTSSHGGVHDGTTLSEGIHKIETIQTAGYVVYGNLAGSAASGATWWWAAGILSSSIAPSSVIARSRAVPTIRSSVTHIVS